MVNDVGHSWASSHDQLSQTTTMQDEWDKFRIEHEWWSVAPLSPATPILGDGHPSHPLRVSGAPGGHTGPEGMQRWGASMVREQLVRMASDQAAQQNKRPLPQTQYIPRTINYDALPPLTPLTVCA